MPDALKSLPAAPWHFLLFAVLAWHLYSTLPLASFAVSAFALLWLVIRLDRVVKQPVDDLIRILGLEVPSAPVVSLLDISSDSISVHWKALEKKTEIRYQILVNGVNVAEISPQDTSVTVKGLAAGVCYTLRVVAVNSQNFQAASDPVRAQTSRVIPDTNDDSGSAPRKAPTAPSVVPYRGPHEGLVPPLASPSLAKEHRLSVGQKQPASHRRSSPIPPNEHSDDEAIRGASSEGARQAVQHLQRRLNELKQETDELHQQDDEDDRQYQSEREGLTKQRDLLRQELKDKEDETKELKKAVNQLERKNVAVQQRKTNQERALESKRHERRKLRDDMEKWNNEVIRFREMMQSLAEQKKKVEAETQQMLEQAREEREPCVQSMKQLEEQIQQTGRQVKDIEESRAGQSPSSPIAEADPKRLEEDRSFEEKLTSMRMTMQRLWLECDGARKNIAHLQSKATSLSMPRRGSQAGPYDPSIPPDPYSQNSELHGSSQRIPPRTMAALPNVPFSTAAEFDSRAAFVNAPPQRLPFHHSDSSHSDGFLHAQASQADIDWLTGGALASPSANALLPSDLLGDDLEDLNRRHRSRLIHHGSDALGSRPASTNPANDSAQWLSDETNLLPGLGNVPNIGSAVGLYHVPQSPTVNDSRSPSINSSPHGSIAVLHQSRPSEGQNYMDSDRRSIRSTSSSARMGPGRSRFLGDMFSRQRGKTNADEGPALGSLKSGQTRSMPRSYDEADNPDLSPEQKRVSSGSFLGSMSHGLLGRRTHGSRLAEDSTDMSSARGQLPPRHNAFSRLGARMYPWSNTELDSDSRPTSVYSAENALSSQPFGAFGWNGSGVGINRSNTTSSNPVRNPWSPHTSRRGSVQVDGPNASVGELGVFSQPDDADADAVPDDAPAMAPIGTKPSRWAMKKSPIANRAHSPTAGAASRDFKSMFSGKKAARKTSATPSAADPNESQPDRDKLHPDTPQHRRPSTDLASLSATTASTDDLPASAPGTPATPDSSTPTGRESLMRKLTRKSSYIPGLMSSRRSTTAPNTPQLGGGNSAPADSDDDAATGSAGAASSQAASLARTPSNAASAGASPRFSTSTDERRDDGGRAKRASGFSLSSFKRRRGKDKDKEAKDGGTPKEKERDGPPSVSEASVTTSDPGDEGWEGRSSARGSLSVDDA